ncbi:MAG: uroporphyrinogen decarboxylase family protein [Clostridiales bacterium]|jgi:uroporphyrinogen-III decarboxylase|nr:hypothetical protein [Eubacteriales bacterium]MDH7566284.1 uroporphyrinogen decarboxylase family protein [Clostridiales bacterium]
MENKILTPEERLNAAIRLAPVDRVPCAPAIESYAARFAGISQYEFLFDYRKAFHAFAFLKNRYPVWDIRRSSYNMFYGPYQKKIGILRNSIPGIDLPADYEIQFSEFEIMHREDYFTIIKNGYDFYETEYFKRAHGTTKEDIKEAKKEKIQIQLKEIEASNSCGQVYLYGAGTTSADEMISYTRSFPEFIKDLYQVPELMEEIISIATDFSIRECKETVKKTSIPRVMIGMSRMNGRYFSLSYFEKFSWKHLKRLIESLIVEDITPFVHLDGEWRLNLPYFLELPKRKIVIELDGNTDIFLAKKILGEHSCLLGDVPSTMFAVETPDDVRNYCSRLLKEVGQGGGFILGSGCALPYQAEHSNVEAFFNCLSN